MAAARHKRGGKVAGIAFAGGPKKVIEEAKERKKGGKVIGGPDGAMSKRRLDRPGRKRGGRVGADSAPLSSAHGTTSAPGAPKSNSSV